MKSMWHGHDLLPIYFTGTPEFPGECHLQRCRLEPNILAMFSQKLHENEKKAQWLVLVHYEFIYSTNKILQEGWPLSCRGILLCYISINKKREIMTGSVYRNTHHARLMDFIDNLFRS